LESFLTDACSLKYKAPPNLSHQKCEEHKAIDFFFEGSEQEGVLFLPGAGRGFAFGVYGLGELTCVLTLLNQRKQ